MNRSDLTKLLRQVSANMDPGHEGVGMDIKTAKHHIDKLIEDGFLEFIDGHNLRLHITYGTSNQPLKECEKACHNCLFSSLVGFSHSNHEHRVHLKPLTGVDNGVAEQSSMYYGFIVCQNRDCEHYEHLLARIHVCKAWRYQNS